MGIFVLWELATADEQEALCRLIADVNFYFFDKHKEDRWVKDVKELAKIVKRLEGRLSKAESKSKKNPKQLNIFKEA
jgi:hypothetical protein